MCLRSFSACLSACLFVSLSFFRYKKECAGPHIQSQLQARSTLPVSKLSFYHLSHFLFLSKCLPLSLYVRMSAHLSLSLDLSLDIKECAPTSRASFKLDTPPSLSLLFLLLTQSVFPLSLSVSHPCYLSVSLSLLFILSLPL